MVGPQGEAGLAPDLHGPSEQQPLALQLAVVTSGACRKRNIACINETWLTYIFERRKASIVFNDVH